MSHLNINVIDECECNKRENVDYSALPSMVGYISDGKCTVWDIAKKYDTTGDLSEGGKQHYTKTC